MSSTTVTAEQAAALAKYGREYELASGTQGSPLKRAVAVDSLRRARLGLTPAMVAALDFTAGRGVTVQELAAKAGRDPDAIADLIARASKRLVEHYAEAEVA
jgi:hypothetical protein